jgi:hypothetical protein
MLHRSKQYDLGMPGVVIHAGYGSACEGTALATLSAVCYTLSSGLHFAVFSMHDMICVAG